MMGRDVYTYSEIVVGEESGREIVDRLGGVEAVLKCLEGFVPAVAMRGSGSAAVRGAVTRRQGGQARGRGTGEVNVLDGNGQVAL